MRPPVQIYGSGSCPVCSVALLCLRSRSSGNLFFFCDWCGCCFSELPQDYRLDEIVGIDEFAPDGIDLPTWAQLESAGQGYLNDITDDVDFEDLRPHLRPN